ncbi:MAG: translocation/assembly module TamB [Bacteroidales bacterium]|nr:translocation/assembly module TamB [Bacteroidales bacterium]
MIAWIVGVFIVLDLLIVGAFFIKPVQNFAADFATKKVSEKWGCDLIIGEIYLTPTLHVKCLNAVLRDYQGNDMIRIGMCETSMLHMQLKPTELYFGTFNVDDAEVVVRRYKGDESVNIALWALNFKKKKKNKTPFVMHSDHLHLTNSEFRFVNDDARRPGETYDTGTDIDYGYFQLKGLELDCKDFLVRSDDISAEISRLACYQYTGFKILNSSGRFRINSENLIYKNAYIVTENSRIFLDFAMQYHQWQMGDFTNTVDFNAHLRPSHIGLKDVAFFGPAAEGLSAPLVVSGDVFGPVNDLHTADFYIAFAQNTFFYGNFDIGKVTDIKNVTFDFDFYNSNVDLNELAQFSLPSYKTIELPAHFRALHNNHLSGTVRGDLDNFATRLHLQSEAGEADVDLQAFSDPSYMMTCDATIQTNALQLGKIINSPKYLGSVSLTASVSGNFASPIRRDDCLETANLTVHSFVNQLNLLHYPLRNAKIDASYKKKRCSAKLLTMDPNVQFDVDGFYDFSQKMPQYQADISFDKITWGEVFSHFATIDTASAKGFDKFIAFGQQHPDMNLACHSLKVNLIGDKLDNLSGVVLIDTLTYTQDQRQLQTDMLRLVATNIDNGHKYRLTSDMINVSLATNYKIAALADSLYAVAQGYFPNLLTKNIADNPITNENFAANEIDSSHYLTVDVETFALNRCLSFFVPQLSIAPKTQIYIHQNSDIDKDSIYIDCRRFVLKDVLAVNNLHIESKEMAKNDLRLALNVDSIAISSSQKPFVFKGISLKTNVKTNKVDYDLNWTNPDIISTHPSWLAGTFETLSKNKLSNHFTASELYVKDYLWHCADSNHIVYQSGNIEVENLLLKSSKSSINVSGKYTKKDNEPLMVALDNLDLSVLNTFFGGENIKFDGRLTGSLALVRKNGKPMITGKVLADDFQFNEMPFGDVCLFAVMPSTNRFGFMGGIFEDGTSATVENFNSYSLETLQQDMKKSSLRAHLTGGYTPQNKEFGVKATINSLSIDFLKPFLSSFSHKIEGDAYGELSFLVKPDSAYFDGYASVRHGLLGISALNTIYSLDNQRIDFDKEGLKFNHLIAKDKDGNTATVDGYIKHNLFQNMRMKLDIATDRIMALNAPKGTDMPFYGDGYVSGDISIEYDNNKMRFYGDNIVTQKGTNFVLPVLFSETASESNVIAFKQPAQNDENADEVLSSTEMEFDFNFDVTPDAIVQLELDPSIGGIMQARVEGPLHLVYNSETDMILNGGLVIQSGTFHLAFKDVINKILSLEPGGTIDFLGPLDNATVNVRGIYKTTASLNEILAEEMSGGSSMRRTPVNAYMNIGGPLFNPNIDFSFQLPNSTNDVSTMFFGALDTTSITNRTQQFFSLLVLGKFQKDNTTPNTQMVTSAMEYTGVELLTNTVNNFISQNLKYVNLGINYRNADETHSAEYSVSASTSLYNDRIIIEGSFGYANDKNKVNNNGTNFIGDYSMEYALNEQKNWRVKVFNVTNQYSSLTQTSPYAQGVALIYKQEFNNAKDLKESMKRKKKTDANKTDKKKVVKKKNE